MTGRRLYEIVCDEVKRSRALFDTYGDDSTTDRNFEKTPVAWAFLKQNERSAWNASAKRISPKPKPKGAAADVVSLEDVNLTINDRGPRAIYAIKTIRAHTGLPLRDAIDVSQGKPLRLRSTTADRLADELRSLDVSLDVKGVSER
jgi:ribosomal protein L7/L12